MVKHYNETCLILVFHHHLMGQVKQANNGVLCHTFPHEWQGVPSPLNVKWRNHLCEWYRKCLPKNYTSYKNIIQRQICLVCMPVIKAFTWQYKANSKASAYSRFCIYSEPIVCSSSTAPKWNFNTAKRLISLFLCAISMGDCTEEQMRREEPKACRVLGPHAARKVSGEASQTIKKRITLWF